MGLRASERRTLYTVLWLAAAVVIVWLQIATLTTQFNDNRSLATLSPSDRAATLAAVDRLGITTTWTAVYWLVTAYGSLLLYLIIGVLLVRRGQPAGFAAWLAVIMLCTTAMIYPPEIPAYFPDQPFQTIIKVTTALGVSGFFILPLVFPTGEFFPRWTILLGAYTLFDMALFTSTGQGTTSGPPWVEAIVSVLFFGTILGCAGWRYRRVSDADQRRQTRWVMFGFLIAIPCFLAGDAMMRNIDDSARGTWFVVLFPFAVQIGFSAPFVAVATSVLYHRLFDIDVMLGRTLVWLAMTAAVVGTYIVVVLGLGAALHIGDNLVLSLIATGLVAVMFQPVRARVQRAVNRFVFGDRDDPYTVISRLGQQLAGAAGLSDLMTHLAHLTADALRVPYVALYLNRADGVELAAAVGAPIATAQRYPLAWQGTSVGALVVAPRGAGESFNAADRRLLADLTSQFGLAAHAIILAQDLQVSRERIVTSREEERRRLRRDLHDGLGAQLAALTMQAGIARSLVRSQPGQAEAELDLLRDELRVALADIRQLVQGLRPPALDELGLGAALRSRLDRVARGTPEHPLALLIDIADPLPPLRAAAEVAVYRIVEEAVTNVLRHAHATTLRVSIQPDAGELVVEVTDDGTGLPTQRGSGVGWQSMQERATELGGTVTIGPGPAGRGTTVRARIPLEPES